MQQLSSHAEPVQQEQQRLKSIEGHKSVISEVAEKAHSNLIKSDKPQSETVITATKEV